MTHCDEHLQVVRTKGYTVCHTVTHYGFHEEMFSVLCFVCLFFVCFLLGDYKASGQIQRDRKMSGTRVHEENSQRSNRKF